MNRFQEILKDTGWMCTAAHQHKDTLPQTVSFSRAFNLMGKDTVSLHFTNEEAEAPRGCGKYPSQHQSQKWTHCKNAEEKTEEPGRGLTAAAPLLRTPLHLGAAWTRGWGIILCAVASSGT